jgi:DNA-binding GntR family transcriptional regulator
MLMLQLEVSLAAHAESAASCLRRVFDRFHQERGHSAHVTYLNKVFFQAMMNGRSFLNIPLWGMVEDRLSLAFGQIWADIIAQPDQDIEAVVAVVARHLDAAVSRLNVTLAQ